ncbi:MAG: thioredoxin domain-containing protein [Candidatus Symbiobacter sp.]|nr:thioredoxin domain-containing protein [Candidatus Symbiobacter sp.]
MSAKNPNRNRLATEKSLYLRQHGDNPVDWYPWGDAAFEAARQRGVAVMVSIGYAACHWCHVMAHESFADDDTAAMINANFVAVKIDREERPDLDSIYMRAVAMMGVDGGWPLTLFVTPDRVPFWGGTYFPPTPRYGRPSFRQVLENIAEIYASDPERIATVTQQMQASLSHKTAKHPGTLAQNAQISNLSGTEMLALSATKLYPIMDLVHGGIAGAPKFPHTALLELFWCDYLTRGKKNGDKTHHDVVTRSLDKICAGGIYDHLGGGFARYATDERWLVPHFEKMLYDNAQLVSLLTQLWQATQSPIYAARIADTIDWLQREMLVRDEAGTAIGLAASLDADSMGGDGHSHEGAFYVWDKAEIDEILGIDAAEFSTLYDVTAKGNWEGRNILNLLASDATLISEPIFQQKLAILREKLRVRRDARPRPLRDDKILADWNGLAIAALVRAGLAFERQDWLALAANLWHQVRDKLRWPGASDSRRLAHSYAGGRAAHPASLDDYAFLILASLELYQATENPEYLHAAEQWVQTVRDHYADPENGGYFFAADDTRDIFMRPKITDDNATKSGQAAMADIFVTLFYLTGRDEYRDHAESLIAALRPAWQRNILGLAGMCLAAARLDQMVQIFVAGARSDPQFQAFWRVANQAALPHRILVPQAAVTATSAPFYGKTTLAGEVTAYVCVGQKCSLPLHSAEALAEFLAEL